MEKSKEFVSGSGAGTGSTRGPGHSLEPARDSCVLALSTLPPSKMLTTKSCYNEWIFLFGFLLSRQIIPNSQASLGIQNQDQVLLAWMPLAWRIPKYVRRAEGEKQTRDSSF